MIYEEEKYVATFPTVSNLLKDQIAYYSKVDVSDCPPVQEMLRRLVNKEAYEKYAEKTEERLLVDELPEPEVKGPNWFKVVLSTFTP